MNLEFEKEYYLWLFCRNLSYFERSECFLFIRRDNYLNDYYKEMEFIVWNKSGVFWFGLLLNLVSSC